MYVAPADDAPGYREIPINASHPKMMSAWHVLGPEALYWAPRQVRSLWGAESIFITENGCASSDVVADDGKVYDSDRVMFLLGLPDAAATCHRRWHTGGRLLPVERVRQLRVDLWLRQPIRAGLCRLQDVEPDTRSSARNGFARPQTRTRLCKCSQTRRALCRYRVKRARGLPRHSTRGLIVLQVYTTSPLVVLRKSLTALTVQGYEPAFILLNPAECWSTYVTAIRQVRAEGIVVLNPETGCPRKNPALAAAEAAATQLRSLANELGLSPAPSAC